MFTPKKPYRFNSGQDDVARLTLTISDGGSTASEATDVAVIPLMSSPRPTVTTLTPPARWRIAPRNSPSPTENLRLRTIEFMTSSRTLPVVAGPQQLAQDRAFQPREFGRAARPG